ncbi:MAG: hypothetical protein NZ899_15250, partial [Thermoguttaceae bacterium]|nr:hypothetical protein [Thermoguttaceae bacterium]
MGQVESALKSLLLGTPSGGNSLLKVLRTVSIYVVTLFSVGCVPAQEGGSSCFSNRQEGPVDAVTTDEALLAARRFLELSGYSPEAAEAVARLNERLFRLLYREDQQLFRETLALLGRLGSFPTLQAAIERHPEVASLAATSLEADPQGPQKIFRSIRANESHRDAIYAMYTFYAEPVEAIRLAERLERFGSLLAEVWEEEFAHVYHFMRELPPGTLPEAADVYFRWVENIYMEALRHPDATRPESLASAATVLFCHSDEVLRLLNADKAFRDRFLTVYWPRVVSLVEKQQLSVNDPEERELMWDMPLSEPRLWQFLHETACENKLEQALGWLQSRGRVAIDLWLAPQLKDRQIRERLIDALTHADEVTLSALANEDLRAMPAFWDLLKRPLPRAHIAAALHRLGQHPGEELKLLGYWSQLSDYALTQELLPEPSGPATWLPGYQVYYVIQKARQGRAVTHGETFFAFLDAISLVPIGFGGTKLLEIAGKKAVQKMAAKTASSRLKELFLKELPETVGWRRVGTAFRS